MQIIIAINDPLDYLVVEEEKHEIMCELHDVMASHGMEDIDIYLDDADDEEI